VLLREFAGCLAADHQGTHDPIGGEQGNHQARAITQAHDHFVCSGRRLQIGHLIRFPPLRRRRDGGGEVGVVLLDHSDHLRCHSIGRAQLELLVGLVKDVDRTSFST
jgi:hypothetical protein